MFGFRDISAYYVLMLSTKVHCFLLVEKRKKFFATLGQYRKIVNPKGASGFVVSSRIVPSFASILLYLDNHFFWTPHSVVEHHRYAEYEPDDDSVDHTVYDSLS
jgi:hypothetical protein